MWNATITDVKRSGTSTEFVYQLTNGIEVITLNHIGDKETLNRQIASRIASLTKSDVDIDQKGTLIGPVTPIEQPISLATTFIVNLNRWRQYKRAINEGLVLPDEKAYMDLEVLVKSTFLPEYIDLI